MDYTVTLTEAENKAMEYAAADVQDWFISRMIREQKSKKKLMKNITQNIKK
jgi:hypothetical protein